MTPRTAIYARQSRDNTGKGLAVERQVELARKLAESRDLGPCLDPIIDNDVSASTGKTREGYERLLSLVEAGQLDAIVAYHPDRLLRSLVEMEHLIALCEKHGVRIMTVAGDIDLSTDMGRLVGRILASVARGEVERKGRRQKDAAVQAAQQGAPPSRGAFGHARWHRRDGERYQPPAEQVAAEADAVRGCYEGLFAGKSPGRMADELNEAGHRTTRGNLWTRSEVRAMLLNPRNAGVRYLHGERVGLGNWPAIVSEETWLAAKSLLDDPARRTSPGSARKWLGGGLYLCGLCNESDMASSRRWKGERGYRCRTGMHNNRSAEKIDHYVLHTVAARLGKIDVVRLLGQKHPGVDVPALRTEAAGVRARLVQLGVDYAEGDLTAAQVRVATQRLEARLAEIDTQLAAVGRGDQLAEIVSAEDPGQAFLDADLSVQRGTLERMCTVTVLPNTRGRWAPISETMRIDFTNLP
ncbi:recombinase family protein [Amycolatopsis sp. NPDC001319]|uniref:recombinase family protein n=1 Tax=unclassified Amycolatopsis TaxID=2618356 RepID=UPI00369572F3